MFPMIRVVLPSRHLGIGWFDHALPVCVMESNSASCLPSEGSTASRIWKIHTSSSSMTCILPASNPKVPTSGQRRLMVINRNCCATLRSFLHLSTTRRHAWMNTSGHIGMTSRFPVCQAPITACRQFAILCVSSLYL